MHITIRPTTKADSAFIRKFMQDHWGDETVFVHGAVYRPEELDGFIAEVGRSRAVGLATYVVKGDSCELVTLNSRLEGEGIGTALVQAVADAGSNAGCNRLWCVTTNDNFPALTFYQKRGLRIAAVYPGAVERARMLKPTIPLYGIESVPIRDEIELEIQLHPASTQ
jgi:GNAT superfamily N-acetyltransferase